MIVVKYIRIRRRFEDTSQPAVPAPGFCKPFGPLRMKKGRALRATFAATTCLCRHMFGVMQTTFQVNLALNRKSNEELMGVILSSP